MITYTIRQEASQDQSSNDQVDNPTVVQQPVQQQIPQSKFIFKFYAFIVLNTFQLDEDHHIIVIMFKPQTTPSFSSDGSALLQMYFCGSSQWCG